MVPRSPRRLPPRGPDGRFRALRQVDLRDPSLLLNRELSWLEFNRRVLDQAADTELPLLERLRFIAIFSTNLDEFFMVRVAGLNEQVAEGRSHHSPDGMSATDQLQAITRRVRPMLARATLILHEQILPLLARRGIGVVHVGDLDARTRRRLEEDFTRYVFPVLTPLAIDPGHPFPYISNLSLSLAVQVADRKTGHVNMARVKVPELLPRFWQVPGTTRAWVPLEDMIAWKLDALFPGMDIVTAHPFRVTRNVDLPVEEAETADLMETMQTHLVRRRFGSVVRLEVASSMPEEMLDTLREELDISPLSIFDLDGIIGRGDLDQLADLDQPSLRFPPLRPAPHPDLAHDDLFAAIRRRDALVHQPYHSFDDTVQRLLALAAEDPAVLAIKMTLYRTARDSAIVAALERAAQLGKQVVALVELKARFDEEANIGWAQQLERAGVHVVYGLLGLKTHTKAVLIVRREDGRIRRYAHLGSGNYHPTTARTYTDVGLVTAHEGVTADVGELFNYLTGRADHDDYAHLMVAPISLRERLVGLIQREASRRRRGLIRLKVNAITDPEIILELYRADRAGAQVVLIVRGMCTLRPDVTDVSDHITVLSVIDRLLEHERILQFGEDVWIGSADLMTRNLDRRVEAMVPLLDPRLREEAIGWLDVTMADAHAWRMQADGSWTHRDDADGPPTQEVFLRLAHEAARVLQWQ